MVVLQPEQNTLVQAQMVARKIEGNVPLPKRDRNFKRHWPTRRSRRMARAGTEKGKAAVEKNGNTVAKKAKPSSAEIEVNPKSGLQAIARVYDDFDCELIQQEPLENIDKFYKLQVLQGGI